jgi:hypothetical protein
MALISCAECGREVSDKAGACPNCGAPIQDESRQATPIVASNDPPSNAASALGIAAVVLAIGGVVMPYFAAVFLVPAAFLCGVIAFKRGQRRLGGAGVVLALIGLISIVYVSQQISNITRDPFAPNALTGGGASPIVTLTEYEQVRDGMSYAQTVGIIGAAGNEMSRSELAGFTTVMYGWSNSNGSNMNAMFQSDRLVNKAQFGLR